MTTGRIPAYNKLPHEWTADEAIAVSRAAEYFQVGRLELDLSEARDGDAGTAHIEECGFARYIRLAPEPGSGEVYLSLAPDTRANTKLADGNYFFAAPGQALEYPFQQFAVINAAQAGSKAVIEFSNKLPLPQVIEPGANNVAVQNVNQVAAGNANPDNVIRAWIGRNARAAAANNNEAHTALYSRKESPALNNNIIVGFNNLARLATFGTADNLDIPEGKTRVVAECSWSLTYVGQDPLKNDMAEKTAIVAINLYCRVGGQNGYNFPLSVAYSQIEGRYGVAPAGGNDGYLSGQAFGQVAPFEIRRFAGDETRDAGVVDIVCDVTLFNSDNTAYNNTKLDFSSSLRYYDVDAADSPFGA